MISFSTAPHNRLSPYRLWDDSVLHQSPIPQCGRPALGMLLNVVNLVFDPCHVYTTGQK
jgi:hypothetical protein